MNLHTLVLKELRYCRSFPQALWLGDPPGGSGGGGAVFIQMLRPSNLNMFELLRFTPLVEAMEGHFLGNMWREDKLREDNDKTF